MAASSSNRSKRIEDFIRRHRLAQVESRSKDSRVQHRQFGFERASYLVGKPGRRFHDDVDNQLSPGGCQLQFLFFEFSDGLLNSLAGVFPNVGAII
ncbi:hypothetical protein PPGU19_078700 (plasmid) [Paraburkholderia sp. PGU19]|nr:hypothetical protein PPGU19_078700 [Paraburkholderia sp. PGU19]